MMTSAEPEISAPAAALALSITMIFRFRPFFANRPSVLARRTPAETKLKELMGMVRSRSGAWASAGVRRRAEARPANIKGAALHIVLPPALGRPVLARGYGDPRRVTTPAPR